VLPSELIFSYFCDVKTLEKTNKIAFIRVLLIGTQILLMGFVAHWLSLQYREREQLLDKDLSSAWMDSRQQMVDSMLVREYIQPAMDSSAKFDFQFDVKGDSLRTMVSADSKITTHINVNSEKHQPQTHGRIIVRISDTTMVSGKKKLLTENFMSRDMVLRGVKLFVNRNADSSQVESISTSNMFLKPDTVLLKSAFNSRVKSLDEKFKLIWTIDSILDTIEQKIPARFYMHSGSKTLTAQVEGYQLFILRKMLPQIGFAFFLVFLTAAAFVISFLSLKKQIRLNVQRNDFIRNMSHELKTPVATVKVAIEALKNFNRRNEQSVMEEYLLMAASETNRLEMLISKVINIAANNGDAILPTITPVNINELILEVIQAFKPQIEADGAVVKFNSSDDRIIVHFDRMHLQGVLINLIDNGLKYSAKHAQIEIDVRQDTSRVKISVSDRGIGIPDEYRNRIFDKFFRVPTGELHNVKGYGLGLSYAAMVMKQHSGEIHYYERNGGGSIFELIIPFST